MNETEFEDRLYEAFLRECREFQSGAAKPPPGAAQFSYAAGIGAGISCGLICA